MGYLRDTLLLTVFCGALMGGAVYAAQLAPPAESWLNLAALVAVGMATYPLLSWYITLGRSERQVLAHLGRRLGHST